MHCDNRSIKEPGFARFAAETMLPLLSQLDQELSGVVSSDDIEYIHRARVATRRLRACLGIFSSCFPKPITKKWSSDIRLITRALGEARDLDVQIDFIQSYISSHIQDTGNNQTLFFTEPDCNSAIPAILSSQTEPDNNIKEPMNRVLFYYLLAPENDDIVEKKVDAGLIFTPADPIRPGLECLLLRLQQRRSNIQQDVVKTVERFESDRITKSMRMYLHEQKIRAELEGVGIHTQVAYQEAFLHIMAAKSVLFSFEPSLSDPTMVHRHHEMRIAGKKLRYTLESFSGLFECKLKSEIKTFKELQDILGDMHDCDVWIENLPTIAAREEKRTFRYFGNHLFFSLLKPGFHELLESRIQKRKKLFSDLQKLWNSLKEDKFWEQLEEKITKPIHYSFQAETGNCTDKPLTLALISDVHANLPALEAVLTDAKEKGATAVCNAGDSIGYGAFPDEVVTRLRNAHVLSVMGNYDRSVLTQKWKLKKIRSSEKKEAMQFAYRHLSKENREYLKNLPRQIKLRIRDKNLLITHGSPDSLTEYLVMETPDSRYSEIVDKTDADVIITGHSHLPSIKSVNGVWFINCGSVGRSEDGDPRACYALLTVDPFSIIHIRVPYEIDKAIEAIYERHLPESFAKVISEGKPLDLISDRKEGD
ncbi:MAG: CHAD domain-containing protein [Methanomicrobiales archaeon]|nr:CHAD domain-containing protein [Methanomicrobiales archaeon]